MVKIRSILHQERGGISRENDEKGVDCLSVYIGLCAISYLLGAAALGGVFYVQHLENVRRPEGYHVKATVTKTVEQGDCRELFFSFFLNGTPIRCSAHATLEESAAVREKRDYLIVYNDQTKKCLFNPCAVYRKRLAVLIVISFLFIAFATLLVLQGFAMHVW